MGIFTDRYPHDRESQLEARISELEKERDEWKTLLRLLMNCATDGWAGSDGWFHGYDDCEDCWNAALADLRERLEWERSQP